MRSPFSRAQLEALEALSRLWGSERAFVLIGAGAIHCHRAGARGTEDLDIAVAVAREEMPLGLDTLPGWRRHPSREHEWIGPGEVRLDVMPAGRALLDAGYVEWTSGQRMNLCGFEHAFVRHERLALNDRCAIAVADLAVVVLLKVVAYLDRPGEREHDLHDIAFVIDEYVAVDDERRWSDEIVGRQVPYALVGAFLLGRDLAAFVTARDRALIDELLGRARRDADATLARLVRLAPRSWGQTDEGVLDRLDMLAAGLSET